MNDINERWLRWRRERGYKKGRGKGKRGCFFWGGLAYDCGVGCDCWDLLCFGDLRNLWRFLGLLRGGKYCYLGVDLSLGHTHYIWLDLGSEG